MSTRLYSIVAGAIAAISCSSLVERKEEPSTQPSNSPQGQRRAVNVTQLYNDNCSKCHGYNAEGGGAGTKTLNTKDKFDQKWDKVFFDAIKKGVPDAGMEAYGDTNSDQEVWALVVHIRELQNKALRAEFGDPKSVNGVFPSKYHAYKVETVVDRSQGLQVPWAIDWLPDGRMLITNRSGWMAVVKNGKVQTRVEGLPKSVEIGQGGLMDVGVHPDYAKNGWIYLTYTDPKKDSDRAGLTKFVRGKLKFDGDTVTWTNQETLLECDQEFYTGAGIHFGSKIAFDGKGHVFFNIGERGSNEVSQQKTVPFGKIYRLNDDGSIPSDNPYATESKKFMAATWSMGHRNPQGVTVDLDGQLWNTEHAPRGGDELNRVVKSGNYGWPMICFGINYNDSPFRLPWNGPGQNYLMPVFRWLPSCAASGLEVVKGNAFPMWKGDLIAGGLAGQNVDRIRVKGDNLIEREELIHGMGRVRDIGVGADGYIYVVLNQPDIVVRLVPAK